MEVWGEGYDVLDFELEDDNKIKNIVQEKYNNQGIVKDKNIDEYIMTKFTISSGDTINIIFKKLEFTETKMR